MSSLTPFSNTPASMSSREIAELTGKRHDHVMRDIEAQLTELLGAEGLPKFGDTYRNEQNGQIYRMYRLPKRECLIVVSGYSVELRAKIIDRWMELEAQSSTSFALPKTKAEALFLAAEQARIIEEQEAILTEQEPKVLLYDQLADSDGLIRFPNLLGMLKGKTGQDYKMADLKLFLRKAGMMCWQKELQPTVKAIDSDWFAVRYEDRTYDGVIHKVPEWAVTPKGFLAIWNVVAQPQRRYGQSSTQTALLTAANAAQQEGVRRIADESQRTYNATELGQQMTPPLSAIMVNRQLNIAGLIRKEFGDWLPTDAAEGLFELTDVSGRRHSNGTQVKQIKWFKRVLERLNPGSLKEAA